MIQFTVFGVTRQYQGLSDEEALKMFRAVLVALGYPVGTLVDEAIQVRHWPDAKGCCPRG